MRRIVASFGIAFVALTSSTRGLLDHIKAFGNGHAAYGIDGFDQEEDEHASEVEQDNESIQ